jgi:L-cysteine desulfidase
MLRSVAVSHLVNAYVKCYLGELSAICGCALAAGLGAAVAIVYQRVGNDLSKITKAINNVIGDLGGMVCDGAKPGCALKVVTSVDSALRSALMALEGFGLTEEQGMLGATAEESLRQLSRLSREGMMHVDATMLRIIEDRENADQD